MSVDGADDPPFPDDTLSKGWRFELHMEKVKKSDTWLRARTGFVRAHLLLLWSEAWEQTPCGTLPDDDELVALLLDMDADTFAKHRTVLMRGWKLAGNGRLYHETITDRVLAMLEKRKSDAQRTAASRARRSGQHPNHDGATPMSHVTHGRDMSEFDTKHQAPSTSTSTRTGTRREDGIEAHTAAAPPLPGNLPPGYWPDDVPPPAPAPKKPRKRGAPAALVSLDALVAEGVEAQHAADWLTVRSKKSLPLTITAWTDVKDQATAAGMTVGEAIKHAAVAGWGGFKSKWIEAERAAAPRAGGKAVETDEQRATAGALSTAAAAKLLGFTTGTEGEAVDAPE